MVKKYEPDNKNLSIDSKMFNYSQNNMLTGVIKIYNITAKAKFGQNMTDNEIKMIIDDLKIRGEKTDMDTIDMINKVRK